MSSQESSELIATVEYLRQQVAILQSQQVPQPLPPQPQPQPLSYKEPRLTPLARFSGLPGSDFRGFMNQLELNFRLNSSRFPDDSIKIQLLGTLLEGPALRWFNPMVEQPDRFQEYLSSWSAFKDYMAASFGHGNATMEANRGLKTIRQGRRSVLEYATAFRQLAVDSDWGKTNPIDAFTLGLSEDIQDRLLSHPEAEDLEGLIHLAI